MKTMRPFVDYYGAHGISPVAQDISDLQRHFGRRESLYRSLGIPPLYVRGRDVIEFGPGSGFNALYTEHLAPQRYVLVDANPRGVADTRALLAQIYPGAENYAVVSSLIEEFASPDRFDLVLAEGLIPFQHDPAAFSRSIARFTADRGILVITCADAPTIMGEIGRRLLAYKLCPIGRPDAERVKLLAPVFAPHLATLRGMSRSVEDWVYDNILIPFVGRTFGIDEAVKALADEFDVYGTSPEFIVDLRWYKQIFGDERRFNEHAARAYLENMLNFLDYRVTLPPHDALLGLRIRDVCRDIYALMQEIEASGGARSAAEAAPAIRTVAALAAPSPRTARALTELADALAADTPADTHALPEFRSYFGRGMQYASFIKRGSSLLPA